MADDTTKAKLDRFVASLRPLLERKGAHAAYVFGSHARGDADDYSDVDVIIVAPSEHPPVDRFLDYLPAIAGADLGVDLFVYTPEEFARLREEERPFLVHALKGARTIHER